MYCVLCELLLEGINFFVSWQLLWAGGRRVSCMGALLGRLVAVSELHLVVVGVALLLRLE